MEDFKDVLRRELSVAGITVAEIERGSGIGHTTLSKYLDSNRVLSPEHLRRVIAEVAKRNREAARRLLDHFAIEAGFEVIEGEDPRHGGGCGHVASIQEELEHVGQVVEVFSDNVVDLSEFRVLRQSWRDLKSRKETFLRRIERELAGKRAVAVGRVAA